MDAGPSVLQRIIVVNIQSRFHTPRACGYSSVAAAAAARAAAAEKSIEFTLFSRLRVLLRAFYLGKLILRRLASLCGYYANLTIKDDK